MTSGLLPSDARLGSPVLAEARRDAEAASARAGVEARDLVALDDILRACTLLDEVWDAPRNTILPTNLARAMSHAGACFAAAFAGGEMVGVVVGFVGFREGSHLHSHLLGVRPGGEHQGVGFALKQHQRLWALERDLTTACWTFDPLVRRNAYFNLGKLGAVLSAYHVDFYGAMQDGLNVGDETDRALVRWELTSPRATSAVVEGPPDVDVDRLITTGAVVILDEDLDFGPVVTYQGGDTLLCRIPTDVVAMRQRDPALALLWRKALRVTLGRALTNGYVATGISRSGWYVLERERT